MKNSPWAKLIRRATPSMSASPAATMAYMEPRVRPCSTCSRTSEIRSVQQRRARLELLQNAKLAVAHLEQDHVDPRLVVVIELDRPERRVLDVDLLQRRADGLAIGSAVLLQRDLDRRHDRPLERDGGQAAVDARRYLVALGPPLVPVGIETDDPVAGLDDAVADLRVVAHLVEELGGGEAAAREHLLRQPQLAELAHERRAVAGQDDGQDRLGVGALQAGEHGAIVRLPGIEKLGGDERDARLLERRLVGDGGRSERAA